MAAIYKRNDKFGLMSDDGHPLTDADFDRLDPFEIEGSGYHIGYVSAHPYLIRSDDGAVFDIFRFDEECNLKEAMERILNWTMPGLQLFYRDTDMPLDSEKMYRVGEVLRAGFFIDVSPYAGKPMHKFRYIIASAHAASLVEEGDRYPLHVLHANSYLKVLDVYEKDGVTQIFLIHVPAKSIFLPILDNLWDININGDRIVDIARKSLDDKLRKPVRENLEEPQWLERTEAHIGFDNDGERMSLFPILLYKGGTAPDSIVDMGNAIRKMGDDKDPINLILEEPQETGTPET